MKFHFLENDETTDYMTRFLIRDNEAEAKCRFFVISLDNFKVSIESQLRKSSKIFSSKGDVQGSQLSEKLKV